MHIDTLYDQGVGIINEDTLLVADPLFGVFDGASGLIPYQDAHGTTGAALASRTAREVFAHPEDNDTLVDLTERANRAIAEAMREKGIDLSNKTARWATSAAVVKITQTNFEWVQITDSLILTIGIDGTFRVLVDNYDHDRESMRMWRTLADAHTENIRELLKDQLLKVRAGMNINYGVLDGEPEMTHFLHHGTVPLAGLAHIVLFTDGLILPKENPDAPDDFATFVDLFLAGGLPRVHEYVRTQEASDPKTWKFPRYKIHDDIAAIALSF